MPSLANKVMLPGIEEIERYHGDFIEEDSIIDEESEKPIDIDQMIRDAEAECERIIAEAKEQAELIEQRAIDEGEKLKATQAKLGYLDGMNKGEKEMEVIIKDNKDEFARQVAALQGYREQMFEAVKENVVDCLKMLCRKIIFHEFDSDDAVVNSMINHYYYMIKDRSNLVLTVSQEDYKKLEIEKLANKEIAVKIDETFSHGDLTISCDAEGIDFGLEEQIDKAERSIGV